MATYHAKESIYLLANVRACPTGDSQTPAVQQPSNGHDLKNTRPGTTAPLVLAFVSLRLALFLHCQGYPIHVLQPEIMGLIGWIRILAQPKL